MASSQGLQKERSTYFLDPMMKHLGARYYVGLLNAASYRGASHQAVMNYTVVADKVLKPLQLKELTIFFITKSNFDEIDEIDEIEKVAGRGGYYKLSDAELTVIDLIRFQKKSGLLNNIATVLEDLFDTVDLKKLKKICLKKSTPTSTIQRLGYLLDEVLKSEKEAKSIYQTLKNRKTQKIPLSTANKEDRSVLSTCPLNKKWNIIENTIVELD